MEVELTRYIAIPKIRERFEGTSELPRGYSSIVRSERIETLSNQGLQDERLRMSEQLAVKIEEGREQGYRIVATPSRQTPITGVTIIEGDPSVAEDLQNDMPNHDVFEDFELNLISPTVTDGAEVGRDEIDAWHVETVKLKSARGMGFSGSGEGVGVAVLDTGITKVAELANSICAAYEIDQNMNIKEIATKDTNGHGTGVAALIAGKTVGIAPSAKLINIITTPHGRGTFSNFLAATEFTARQPNISIANISAGIRDWEPRIKPGIQALLDTNVLPVVAVGNEGVNSSRSPGNYSEVLSVGASRENGRVWSGSGSVERSFEGMNYSLTWLLPATELRPAMVTASSGDIVGHL